LDRIQIALIAGALALLVISFLIQPSARPPRQDAPSPPKAPEVAAESPGPAETTQRVEPRQASPRPVTSLALANDAVEVRLSSAGGRIESVRLKGFADRKQRHGEAVKPVELLTDPSRGVLFLFLGPDPLRAIEALPHHVSAHDARHAELRIDSGEVEIVRKFALDEKGYGGRLEISVRNRALRPIQAKLDLVMYGQERPASAPDAFPSYSLFASSAGEIERLRVAGIGQAGFFSQLFGGGEAPQATQLPAPVEFAGVDSQYFMLAAVGETPREATAVFDPLGPSQGRAVLSLPPVELPPGTGLQRSYRLYMGPKITAQVRAVDVQLDAVLDVGWSWVRPLVDLFSFLLKGIHDRIIPNYGVAIILLTILLRIAVYPLTQRSMTSMKKMGSLAPEMKELQQKYGNDRARLQQEMLKVYRDRGINPMSAMGGGCIPVLIQMPFMVALYFALQSSIELRHAPFLLWIDDLSAPEDLLDIGPVPLRILPLLMGGSMLLQQKLAPSPSADDQQRQMMNMMSILFVIMFYGFPSGLVLYWFVSNLLGILQQVLVNRAPSKRTAQ
jgi:YidC/Oxa1 family membrane protein insertase